MSKRFEELVEIVERLRVECPWDREQTHESIRSSLIEEAYEAVDAVDREDWDSLKKELGDVILNAIFHAVMASETGRFSIDDVLEAVTAKLIVRHPHVFGDVEVESTEQVLGNWEEIKQKEEGRASLLDGIPSSLPALQYADRIQSKAARVGFDFPVADDAWDKVDEELREFHEIPESDEQRLAEEFGDVLFAIVNYGRLLGIDPEMALRGTNAKFVRRFQFVETSLEKSGSTPSGATLEEMDRLWDHAKSQESSD
jgi:MazG family protein